MVVSRILVRVALLCFLVPLVASHSWVACTDYKEENGLVYDPAKCHGFARAWKDFNPTVPFGTDLGFDHQSKDTCQNAVSSPLSANYDATSPMATYAAGGKVCLAWPPKNHVAAKCNNPYIPDGGTQIWYSSSGIDTNFQLLEDWGAFSVPATDDPSQANPRKGYQNCPNFCANNDKALCTGCFTAPSTPGSYNFQWRWGFSGANYISCWDAEVVSDPTGGDVSAPVQTPTPTPTPVQPAPPAPSTSGTTSPTPTPPSPSTSGSTSPTPSPTSTSSSGLADSSQSNAQSANQATVNSFNSSLVALLAIVVVVLVVIIILLAVAIIWIKKGMMERA